ncbi:hypothetical protein ACIPYQ_40870 [Streptomyces sp. NPDC090045]|uniref:hypothetical protein n=1 Tax=Streptomyces sp. NPDC090045 TaxID=3365927 RepID=UPI0038181196
MGALATHLVVAITTACARKPVHLGGDLADEQRTVSQQRLARSHLMSLEHLECTQPPDLISSSGCEPTASGRRWWAARRTRWPRWTARVN